MSRPIPSTHGVYIPGVGITITKANIRDELARRIYENRSTPSPEEIVMTFVTPAERESPAFHGSKRFAKLVSRTSHLMRSIQRGGVR